MSSAAGAKHLDHLAPALGHQSALQPACTAMNHDEVAVERRAEPLRRHRDVLALALLRPDHAEAARGQLDSADPVVGVLDCEQPPARGAHHLAALLGLGEQRLEFLSRLVELRLARALGGERPGELRQRQAIALRAAQRLDDVASVDHAVTPCRG
jgi:hypothetical protein